MYFFAVVDIEKWCFVHTAKILLLKILSIEHIEPLCF